MFKIAAIVLVLAVAVYAQTAQLAMFVPAGAMETRGEHVERGFQTCPSNVQCPSSGQQCCCTQINGATACLTANSTTFVCFNPSAYQCCNYVKNNLLLACAAPSKCQNDSNEPAGVKCVSSATTVILSSVALVAALFALLM